MRLDEYAGLVEKLWFCKSSDNMTNLFIATAGLGEEAGEVLGKLKKFIRDNDEDQPIDRASLMLELGDTIYYWCKICNHFGIDVNEVLNMSIEKIESRRIRGTLAGSGDNR